MLPSPQDHVAINNVFARYCLCLDLEDADGWVALYTQDARYEVFGRRFEGHDGLRSMFAHAPKGLHLGGPPVIEMIDLTRARTTRNLLFVENGSGPMRAAYYHDDLVRTTEGWRVATTHCHFIGAPR